MNRVVLVGRITKDPEIKYTQANVPVVQFTLAVNRPFSGQDGERKADFISCVVWRQQAENLAKYIRKGSQIGVDGRLQVRSYQDNGGVTRYATEVICDQVQFLEPKGSRESGFGDVNTYSIPPAQSPRNDSSFNQDSGSSMFSLKNDRGEETNEDSEYQNSFEEILKNTNISEDDLL